MWLKSVRLYQYRNLSDSEIEFGPQLNLFNGQNGQGKTNLIEAISLLSYARSFRTTDYRQLLRWDATEASVFGLAENEGVEFALGLALDKKGKQPYLNGKQIDSLPEFVGRLLSITFSPDDLDLIKGGPLNRRRFLDRHLVDLEPEMILHLINYARILKHKNALLKSGLATADQVRIWNRSLLPHALMITKARQRLIGLLTEIADEIYHKFSSNDGSLALRLKSSFHFDNEVLGSDVAAAAYEDALERELSRGAALVGPQRDELIVSLNDKDTRAYASQGQIRTVVLALKLGILQLIERIRGITPIVLLDDVDSELDSGRSAALNDIVFDSGRQVFITGTKVHSKVLSEAKIFEINDGNIRTIK